MKNDLFLFGAIMLFLFVLWIYNGGPTQPISFAGPYITPITNVDATQNGYGPDISANEVRRRQSFLSGWFDGETDPSLPADSRSPYAGKVSISDSYVSESRAADESISIHSSADDDVIITGWQLVSAKDGKQVRIPDGYDGGSSREKAVRLEPGEDLILRTGSRSSDARDREYKGTWYAYLEERSDVWRDDDDTITLLDADGKVVDQYSY